MVCRCSSPEVHAQREIDRTREDYRALEKKLKEVQNRSTIQSDVFQIMDVVEVSGNLVLKVRYPSCRDCAFDGDKVLVFKSATAIKALKWIRIDPHFRNPKKELFDNEAPAPTARFPPTSEGWSDAIAYAHGKA